MNAGESSEGKVQAWRKGFWSLFATQFQGAFSDNVFKWIILFWVMEEWAMTRELLTPVVGAIFALPFILFSMFGGMLADRHSKRNIVISTKLAEVIIMSLGLIGTATEQIGILMVVVFLMSTQSAFFGPSKYGLLPETLPEDRLSWGNGYLLLGTFVAIILGALVGGQCFDYFKETLWIPSVILIALALIGLVTSLGIAKIPAANPDRPFQINFIPEFIQRVRQIAKDRSLSLAIVGDVYFFFLGALVQIAILFYGKEVLDLSESTQIGYLQAALAVGIGLGSLLAGYLSEGKIEYGLVPIGALGMAAACLLMAIPKMDFKGVLFILAFLGMSGGFFVVPLAALIQSRPDKKEKGAILAVNSTATFGGVFVASIIYWGYKKVFQLNEVQIFIACGITTLFGSAFVLYRLHRALRNFCKRKIRRWKR